MLLHLLRGEQPIVASRARVILLLTVILRARALKNPVNNKITARECSVQRCVAADVARQPGRAASVTAERFFKPPRAAVRGDLCIDHHRAGWIAVKPLANRLQVILAAHGDGVAAETGPDRG